MRTTVPLIALYFFPVPNQLRTLYLPFICLAMNKPQTVIDVKIATLQITQSKGLKFL